MTRIIRFIFLFIFFSKNILAANFDDVDFHGFMTSGVSKTTSPYLYADGLDKNYNFTYDTKLGFNVTKRINEKLELSAQYLSQFTLLQPRVDVDWAFISYYATDNFTLKLGKHRLPIWLSSDLSEIGRTYPWVRPPLEVYEMFPVRAFNGLVGVYDLPLGPLELSTNAFVGNTEGVINDEIGTQMVTTRYKSKIAYGVYLNLGNDYFSFRQSFVRAVSRLYNPNYNVNNFDIRFIVSGFKFDWRRYVFYTEYTTTSGVVSQGDKDSAQAQLIAAEKSQNPASIQTAAIQNTLLNSSLFSGHAYYVTAGYRVIDDLLVHVTHAQIFSPDDSLSLGSQRSETLGMKYEFNSNLDCKLEWQSVVIPSNSYGLYTVDQTANPISSLPKRPQIYNFSLDLIF
jgi:hypothetical protein